MRVDPEHLKTYKETFFPYAAKATDRVQEGGGRFAYYTSAATAIQILRGREFWMRNTLVMNDYMEVEHGVSCIVDAYNSEAGDSLNTELDRQFPGLSAEIKELFTAWIPGFRRNTFVTCLSEHSAEEDRYGRLSMWRAYGGIAGVALVVNGGVLFRPSTALAAYSSPVAYLDAAAVRQELSIVARKMATNQEVLESLGRDGTRNAIFHMLRFAAICTKHPAFREEQEWRVVASPGIESSPLLPMQVETIGGIPQRILKIKLVDHPDKGLVGLEPTKLIERVLIGPCEHSDVIGQALWHALSDAGVPDPHNKIFHTGIPLRPNQR
jgi:hypothetical protein